MERYRINAEGAVYFVTFTVVEWLPIFVSEGACRIITDSLNFCNQQKSLCTNAFVIMPTHIHVIFFDRDFNSARLIQTLNEFRKYTGRSLSDYCNRHLPLCFSETLRKNASEDRDRRLWQPSRHPELIETESFWTQKLDYLHDNPRPKGLVVRPEYWRFSSAAYYVSDGREQVDVKISALQW
jgi:putative transposase